MSSKEVIYVVRPNSAALNITPFRYVIVKVIRYNTGHISEHVIDYSVNEEKANRLAEAYNRTGED